MPSFENRRAACIKHVSTGSAEGWYLQPSLGEISAYPYIMAMPPFTCNV